MLVSNGCDQFFQLQRIFFHYQLILNSKDVDNITDNDMDCVLHFSLMTHMKPMVCIILATSDSLEMLCKYGQLLSFIDGSFNWGVEGLIVTSIVIAHGTTGRVLWLPLSNLYFLLFNNNNNTSFRDCLQHFVFRNPGQLSFTNCF